MMWTLSAAMGVVLGWTTQDGTLGATLLWGLMLATLASLAGVARVLIRERRWLAVAIRLDGVKTSLLRVPAVMGWGLVLHGCTILVIGTLANALAGALR